MNKVGIVMGTKPASSIKFWVQVDKDRSLSVDDIVKVSCNIPDYGDVDFYGVVEEVEKGFEGLEFDSWNNEAINGVVPFERYHIASILITRIIPSTPNGKNKEIFLPPNPGSEVYLIEGEEENKIAINMDNKENLLPAGLLSNGEVCYINWDFINGTKGAHISISGISGVATKTSYGLFLIHSMLYSNKLKKTEKREIKVIIFNVKGEDLFHIDKPNKNFDETSKKLYEKLGIEPKPFNKEDVTFFSPPRKENFNLPWVKERQTDVKIFSWSLKDFLTKELMEYMFDPSDIDDNFYYVLTHFSIRMKEFAKNSPENRVEINIGVSTDDKKVKVDKKVNIDSLYKDENVDEIAEKIRKGEIVNISLNTLLELYTLKEDKFDFKGLFPKNTYATVSKFIRKFTNVSRSISHIIGGHESRKVDFGNSKVIVVNISDSILNNYSQRFIVGAVLSDLLKIDEDKSGGGYTFIMLDELNKYAPSERESPLKNLLIDISERGRSRGIILIGAQQMISETEPRIISNCSIKVNGRVDSGELESKYYKYLPTTFKEKAKKISSGTMMLYQPDVEVPLVISFPYPPYATRKRETNYNEDDKLNEYNSIEGI